MVQVILRLGFIWCYVLFNVCESHEMWRPFNVRILEFIQCSTVLKSFFFFIGGKKKEKKNIKNKFHLQQKDLCSHWPVLFLSLLVFVATRHFILFRRKFTKENNVKTFLLTSAGVTSYSCHADFTGFNIISTNPVTTDFLFNSENYGSPERQNLFKFLSILYIYENGWFLFAMTIFFVSCFCDTHLCSPFSPIYTYIFFLYNP